MTAHVTVSLLAFGGDGQIEFDTEYVGEMTLEYIFAWLNRGSGQERWDLLQDHRSLSVGDFVVFDFPNGEFEHWKCADVGWERVL